jgi:hypothetical protein
MFASSEYLNQIDGAQLPGYTPASGVDGVLYLDALGSLLAVHIQQGHGTRLGGVLHVASFPSLLY